jgi:hypothetical protein
MGTHGALEYTNMYPGGYGASLTFELASAADQIKATFEFDIAPEDFTMYSGSIVGGDGEMIFEVVGSGPANAGANHLEFGVRYPTSMPQLKNATVNGVKVETSMCSFVSTRNSFYNSSINLISDF